MSTGTVSIQIDRASEEPIYRQLIRQIRLQIESGQLPAGTRLPASRHLAKQVDVSRISVVNAYAELRSQGYLSAHAGRGTFVAKDINPSAGQLSNSVQHAQEDTGKHADSSMRDMMRLSSRSGVINFSHGSPPPEFFPVAHLREALNMALDHDGASALSYEAAEGYLPLRAGVRDYVRALGIMCRTDNVLITGGAQQGVDLVIQALVAEGQTLITSNPTYLGVIDIARARRIQVHGIPMDEHGMRMDMLENYLLEQKPRLIFVQPDFQNPTGQVMALHRRRQLINLANEHRVPVVEDQVYHEFRFDGESIPPLKALDDTGNIIHISAFTKMLLPGLRIGYIIADGAHHERLVRVKLAADISTSGLNQRAMHIMMERGVLSRQLERNNRELRRRRDTALTAAETYFPPGTRWSVPQGGLYMWVQLPRTGPTVAELFIQALQMNVAFAIGRVFHTDGCGNYHMRLNYGLQSPENIERGFRYLGRAWREMACDYDDVAQPPIL
ncbi:MAG: PLP-dependent aminotransferase family protein [Aggregatilineales bacterium]